ncbi:MAG TPA: hypothetical protein VEO00_11690 [Actinomycetota bacterium]|nr:hypothetical protein [Actinomycetota bacterium]
MSQKSARNVADRLRASSPSQFWFGLMALASSVIFFIGNLSQGNVIWATVFAVTFALLSVLMISAVVLKRQDRRHQRNSQVP